MMEDKSKKLYEEAVEKLKEANKELCRPEEDVVAQLVCNHAQCAILNYLRGFLMENGIESRPTDSIENLFEECKIINPHFSEVNLSGFKCNVHKDESRFCNDSSRFSRCFDIADSLDTFLRREKVIA